MPDQLHAASAGERRRGRGAAVERRRVAVVVDAVADDFRLAGMDRRVVIVAVDVRAPSVAVGVGEFDDD